MLTNLVDLDRDGNECDLDFTKTLSMTTGRAAALAGGAPAGAGGDAAGTAAAAAGPGADDALRCCDIASAMSLLASLQSCALGQEGQAGRKQLYTEGGTVDGHKRGRQLTQGAQGG